MSWSTKFGEDTFAKRYRVPPNCVFEIDDFEHQWVFKNKFDFIHGRELEGAVSDELKLFKEVFDHLNPGGYFEFDGGYGYFKSDDGTHEQAENANNWGKLARGAAEQFGKSFENVPKWKSWMEQVGFINVKQEIRKVWYFNLVIHQAVWAHCLIISP